MPQPSEPRSESRPSACFLSHSSKSESDQDFADKLAATLQQHGIETWFSVQRVSGGEDFVQAIHNALVRCDYFLILLSKNIIGSMWVERELNYALSQERLKDKIIPLQRDEHDWGTFNFALDIIQRVDFSDFDGGCRELLRIWGITY